MSAAIRFLTSRKGGKGWHWTDIVTWVWLIGGLFIMFGPAVWLALTGVGALSPADCGAGRPPAVPFAGVAELVDARDLGSRVARRGGSSPSARTRPRACKEVRGRWSRIPTRVARKAHGESGDASASREVSGHAGYRNALRGSQARIQGGRPGLRTRRQGQCAPRRVERPRPHQRLPSRQGAGRPPQARLRTLGHGRGDRGDGARHEQPDRQRARLQASRRSEGDAAVRRRNHRTSERRSVAPAHSASPHTRSSLIRRTPAPLRAGA